MVQSIKIIQYRKLKDLDLTLTPNINAISGTNGTCKTSLLHIISNAFQAVTVKCDWLNDTKCLSAIKAVNDSMNPKVESLTRGDKKYNDPAHGVKGALFNIKYVNGDELEFRRHNSSSTTRYAIKPKYPPGTTQKLPYCPVIYLGLSRLVPFGEFRDDDAIKNINKRLPESYQNEIARLYRKFTTYSIQYSSAQQMGNVKTRAEFDCSEEGIDSNTISAGEDNLFILLTALVSLRYYYENIDSRNTVESVLLIDEVDATLHPAYQLKLLNLFREYSERYKIQIVFTTHSLSLLESMLDKKDNVIYLLDNISNVILMEDPDIYKLKMHLQSLTEEDIYKDRVIPVFSEDEEARFLIKMLLNYFMEIHPDEFRGVERYFHFVDAKVSAENLTSIFSDSKLQQIALRAICILDGDHESKVQNCIISLPCRRSESPEAMIFTYAKHLFDTDSQFWADRSIIARGFSKHYYLEHIAAPIDEFVQKIDKEKSEKKSTKGQTRTFYKKLFNDNKTFIELLFKHWLHNKLNQPLIEKFYSDLRIVFKKVAPYNEINPDEWK